MVYCCVDGRVMCTVALLLEGSHVGYLNCVHDCAVTCWYMLVRCVGWFAGLAAVGESHRS